MASTISFVFTTGFKIRYGVLDFEADDTRELHCVNNDFGLTAAGKLV